MFHDENEKELARSASRIACSLERFATTMETYVAFLIHRETGDVEAVKALSLKLKTTTDALKSAVDANAPEKGIT